MIPALKAAVAHWSGDDAYATVRPPLVKLSPAQRRDLVAALEPTGFSMPGLAQDPPPASLAAPAL
jgi:4-hydroxy-tetrahydrodipicolinate synthase